MRHGHLSDATQGKIRAKVQRLERYFERLTAIEVTVDLEQPNHPEIHLNVSAEHRRDIVARESADDLMRAVDGAVQKAEQQIRKYKERIQDHHRPSGSLAGIDGVANEPPRSDDTDSDNTDSDNTDSDNANPDELANLDESNG